MHVIFYITNVLFPLKSLHNAHVIWRNRFLGCHNNYFLTKDIFFVVVHRGIVSLDARKRSDKNFESSARKICFKSRIREKFPSVSGIRWKFRNVRNKDGDVHPWIRLSRQNDAFRIAPKNRVLHFMAESELNEKYRAGRRPGSKLLRNEMFIDESCETLSNTNY